METSTNIWSEINQIERANGYFGNYYKEHKQSILNRLNEKVKCGCGCNVSKVNMPKHLRTSKHKQIMEMIEVILKRE